MLECLNEIKCQRKLFNAPSDKNYHCAFATWNDKLLIILSYNSSRYFSKL